MKFKIIVYHFKKKAVQETYEGIVELSRLNNAVDFLLGDVLPVKAYYFDLSGEVFCVADFAGRKINFSLATKNFENKHSSASSTGKDFHTGKAVDWSATISTLNS